MMNETIFVSIVVRNHSFYSVSKYFLTNVYEINHLWEEQKWNQMKNDPRSCERNLCNTVRSLKKNLGLQWDLNQWLRDTGMTLWPTKPWSHWCWELVNYVFKFPVKVMNVTSAYEINQYISYTFLTFHGNIHVWTHNWPGFIA